MVTPLKKNARNAKKKKCARKAGISYFFLATQLCFMGYHGCRTDHPLRTWQFELSVTVAHMSPSDSLGSRKKI